MSYTPFKFFGKNLYGRDFVVGDIHGCFTALENLLMQVQFNPNRDRVFAVGDLIDRGHESSRAVEFLNYAWFHSIMGNHERMLIDACEYPAMQETWVKYNGGAWWKQVPAAAKPRIKCLLQQLPMAFEISTAIGQIGVVHADIPTGVDWVTFIKALNGNLDMAEYALWSRNRYKYYKMLGRTVPIDGIDLVVFGHTPVAQPIQATNIYYIDTGAALISDSSLGKLTLLQVHPTLEVFQYDARQTVQGGSKFSLGRMVAM